MQFCKTKKNKGRQAIIALYIKIWKATEDMTSLQEMKIAC